MSKGFTTFYTGGIFMNEQSENIVVGLGEILWDMLPNGKQLGGAPANFAFHAGQFGLSSCVASAIGKDAFGEEIVETLETKKLPFILEEVDYPTGTVPVTLNDRGIPEYEIKEGVAWDNMHYTQPLAELAKKTKAVSFGSLGQRSIKSRETIRAFLNDVPKDDDHLIVFDVNLRQNFYTQDILRESMDYCNVMKINDEELVLVSRMFGYPGIDLKDKCWLLLGKYNLKILVLTCGINGSYVFTPGSMSFLPTPKVEVADTVGAGDAFSATFISSLLNGCSIKKAHHNAVNVSAYVCTQPGAMPELTEELKREVCGN